MEGSISNLMGETSLVARADLTWVNRRVSRASREYPWDGHSGLMEVLASFVHCRTCNFGPLPHICCRCPEDDENIRQVFSWAGITLETMEIRYLDGSEWLYSRGSRWAGKIKDVINF